MGRYFFFEIIEKKERIGLSLEKFEDVEEGKFSEFMFDNFVFFEEVVGQEIFESEVSVNVLKENVVNKCQYIIYFFKNIVFFFVVR